MTYKTNYEPYVSPTSHLSFLSVHCTHGMPSDKPKRQFRHGSRTFIGRDPLPIGVSLSPCRGSPTPSRREPMDSSQQFLRIPRYQLLGRSFVVSRTSGGLLQTSTEYLTQVQWYVPPLLVSFSMRIYLSDRLTHGTMQTPQL